MTLFLVRHGRPAPRPGVPAHEWELDPAGFDDVWALRESGRLPRRGGLVLLPEPKATATAQLLTEAEVGVVDGLREHVRESTDWIDDFAGTVARAFAEPDSPAYDGWEPLAACRDRVVRSVRGILGVPTRARTSSSSGTAPRWTVLVAELPERARPRRGLTGTEPDLARWRAWRCRTCSRPDRTRPRQSGDGTNGRKVRTQSSRSSSQPSRLKVLPMDAGRVAEEGVGPQQPLEVHRDRSGPRAGRPGSGSRRRPAPSP